ncbi:MAG: VIT domain-containing protein [Kofleriaceae bacterium]
MLMTDDEVARFGKLPDAGFGCLQTERGCLPLAALDVDARVAGVVASIEVAQTFVNTLGVPIEATYIFPLPDRAAAHRFRMEVAGRVIEGVIDERGAAREQYDEAIAKGHRAAITEEERPGVFTLRVGNLMPGEAATVRISLVGPLPVDDGEVTFRFPLVVAPRYMPGAAMGGEQAGLGVAADTSLVPDASRISPPVLLPGMTSPVRLGLRVALEDTSVRAVTSSLHCVTVSNRDARVIEVQPGEKLDRDFILRWRLDGSELASALRCIDDADGQGGTFMLTLVPPSTVAVAGKPRDVVFVLDRSGSMSGWKMVAARRAAARMIDTLTSRDRFCTIAFDNTSELLPSGGLVDATDRNRFAAVELLAKVDARGGTEMAEPLRLASGMLAGGTLDRERVIVLVTDGQVGNEDHILRELAPSLRNIKMFTLGVDQAVNAAFLRRLAAAGGGLCELVESEDRLDDVMAKVHRRIGTPIATELSLVPTGLEIDASSVSPSKLPDVYAGAPVTILGRYRGAAPPSANVELVGSSLGDPLREKLSRQTQAYDARDARWLAASWARARIRDLEDRYAAGSRDVESTIISVSKRFGVLSRFTAFLAVDRAEIANGGGRLAQLVQPVDAPAGWDAGVTPLGAPGGGGGASYGAQSLSRGKAVSLGDANRSRSVSMKKKESAPEMRSAPMAPPMAKPAPAPMKTMMQEREKGEASKDARAEQKQASQTSINGAYLVSLATLARERDGHARANATTAIRLVRQRLAQWTEDVRSVGGMATLASSVEDIALRLATATMDQAIAIAGELAALAAGAPPPAAKPPGRGAFWK